MKPNIAAGLLLFPKLYVKTLYTSRALKGALLSPGFRVLEFRV